MKVIIENHIPYIHGLLEPWAQVQYLPSNEITPQSVRDADALLVRTRTCCDEELLAGSKVQFVGTATIGTDHISLDYCRKAGIEVHNAPGCNAPAVAQWVHASIGYWMAHNGLHDTSKLRLGIVGVGHVGSIVARWAKQLGFHTVLNDPLLGMNDSVEDCDIITYHTPLTRDGEYPTWHLCNKLLLERAQRCRLILNASRGAVCDNDALLRWRGDVAIDCWEDEPSISAELLHKAFIATPHIAGYSVQGKQRGTAMVVQALNEHFSFNAPVNMPQAPLKGAERVTWASVKSSYNPLLETQALKACPKDFELLRNNYNLRQETLDAVD